MNVRNVPENKRELSLPVQVLAHVYELVGIGRGSGRRRSGHRVGEIARHEHVEFEHVRAHALVAARVVPVGELFAEHGAHRVVSATAAATRGGRGRLRQQHGQAVVFIVDGGETSVHETIACQHAEYAAQIVVFALQHIQKNTPNEMRVEYLEESVVRLRGDPTFTAQNKSWL